MRVPRWRMMIEPPVTSWPPKAFTPSRCAFESRPFVELPPPFLCAIAQSLLKFRPRLLGCGVGYAVGLDRLDAHLGKVLTVSLQLLVLLLPLQVEYQDLVARPSPSTSAVTFAVDGLPRFQNRHSRKHVAELDRLVL